MKVSTEGRYPPLPQHPGRRSQPLSHLWLQYGPPRKGQGPGAASSQWASAMGLRRSNVHSLLWGSPWPGWASLRAAQQSEALVTHSLSPAPLPITNFPPRKSFTSLTFLSSALRRTWLKTINDDISYPPSQVYWSVWLFCLTSSAILIYLVHRLSFLCVESKLHEGKGFRLFSSVSPMPRMIPDS